MRFTLLFVLTAIGLPTIAQSISEMTPLEVVHYYDDQTRKDGLRIQDVCEVTPKAACGRAIQATIRIQGYFTEADYREVIEGYSRMLGHFEYKGYTKLIWTNYEQLGSGDNTYIYEIHKHGAVSRIEVPKP